MSDQANLFDACRNGDLAKVEEIYASDPGIINIADYKGFTPLIIAVYNDQPAVVDFLLQKGADPNAADLSGNTALMGVCFRGYEELAGRLIEAGADVNQRNAQGAPALTFAATFGHLKIAETLLRNGADITLRDSRGKSPLDHAAIQQNADMIELIQQYMEPPSSKE